MSVEGEPTIPTPKKFHASFWKNETGEKLLIFEIDISEDQTAKFTVQGEELLNLFAFMKRNIEGGTDRPAYLG